MLGGVPRFLSLCSECRLRRTASLTVPEWPLDFDARCGCVKDPSSQLCALVKAGAYEPIDWSKINKPLNLGLSGTMGRPATRTAAPAQPLRPQQARVAPLVTNDYLRFLHTNAQLVSGFDFEKVFQSAALMASLFAS